MPLLIRRAHGRARPGQQHAIGVASGPEAIEQDPPFPLAPTARNLPPAIGHRGAARRFRIGETQAFAQALGVFEHRHSERREAAHRIRREAQGALECPHVGVTGEQRHAAENAIEQSRFRHRGNHRHGTLGKQELEELGADALTRQLVEAGAPGNAGGKPRRIGRTLAGAGFVEVISFPFIGVPDLDALGLDAADDRRTLLRLSNPMSSARWVS